MLLNEAARVTSSAGGRYACVLQQDWCIGDVPNGGYLTSVIHNAVLSESPSQLDLVHVSLHFLTKAYKGSACVTVSKVKSGKNFSVFHVELRQDKPCVVGYMTMGKFTDERGITIPSGKTLPRLEGLSPKAIAKASFVTISNKLEYFPAGFSEESMKGYWVRFREEDLHAICIGVLVDMVRFPKALVDQEEKTGQTWWMPTISLSIHQMKRLHGAYVWIDVHNKSVRNGRMDMDLIVRDSQGEVVAVANHCALIVGAERNFKPKI